MPRILFLFLSLLIASNCSISAIPATNNASKYPLTRNYLKNYDPNVIFAAEIRNPDIKKRVQPNDIKSRIYSYEQDSLLIFAFQQNIKSFEYYLANSLSDSTIQNTTKDLLSDYNIIRKTFNMPIADSPRNIDIDWVNEIAIKLNKILAKENKLQQVMYVHKADMPTYAQQALLQEAKKHSNLEHEITLLTTGAESQVGFYSDLGSVLFIDKDCDLDWRLFATYHELGHIEHEDLFYIQKSDLANSNTDEFKKFTHDIQRIHEYLDLGRTAFDETTLLGRKINTFFNPNIWDKIYTLGYAGILWVEPDDQKIYNLTLFDRAKEQRADLFATEKLFEQQKINSILMIIQKWGLSPYTTAYEDVDQHPSDLERALYIAGFLVSKGIDINAALRNFNSKGVCIDAETAYNPFINHR